MECVELGRLNYYSGGMRRAEIGCCSSLVHSWRRETKANAILVINEIINEMLELRLPQRPYSKIVIGRISGGYNHGKDAIEANIGFEIRSDSDKIVKEVYVDIQDIIGSIRHKYEVELTLKTISNLNAASLKFNHPLVKHASRVMEKLGLEPVSEPTESELSIFLSRQIPTVTLGITHAAKNTKETSMEIEPMFRGIAQVVGVLMAIDHGVCDG